MDVQRGEMVENELDILTTRRDTERRKTEEERRVEALWEESVRRYHERQVWAATDGFAYAMSEWAV